MAAYFTCKNCRQEHLCPLFFADEAAFHNGRFGSNTFLCPITFKKAAYEKQDMFWLRGECERRTLNVRFR